MVNTTIAKNGNKQTELGLNQEGWRVEKLPTVCWFQEGPGLRNWQFTNSGIKVINVTNLENGYLNLSKTRRHISIEEFQKMYRHFEIDDKDIVVASSGNSYAKVAEVRKQDLPLVMNTSVIRFKPLKNMDYGYLLVFLKSHFFKDQIDLLITGGAQPNFGPFHLNRINIFFPYSKQEQNNIGKVILNTDSLIEHLEKLIEKKKAIKQGTMQQLLTGKKRLPGFSGKWGVKKLSEIGKTYGGLSGKTKIDFDNAKYPYIPFMNIMSNPIIDLQYFDYVNIKNDENQNKAINGDLFFNSSSETPEEVGMCSVLQANIQNLYLNSFCFGFRLNRELKTDGLYLSYFFRSPVGRKLIFSLAQGATRYNLSKTNFMKLEIPYPESAEQTRIANVLYDMDKEIKVLEKERDKYVMIKQGMMQNLLTGKIRIYGNN